MTLHEDSICTWAKNKDACNGDSGAPLMKLKDGELIMIGWVSWGPKHCAHRSAPGNDLTLGYQTSNSASSSNFHHLALFALLVALVLH